MTDPDLTDLSDEELAEAIIEKNVGHKRTVSAIRGGKRVTETFYVPPGRSFSGLSESEFVRQWGVAGPLIERVIDECGYDDIQPGPDASDSVARDFALRAVLVLP